MAKRFKSYGQNSVKCVTTVLIIIANKLYIYLTSYIYLMQTLSPEIRAKVLITIMMYIYASAN